MGLTKFMYDIGNYFYRRLATIGGILLIVVLFLLSWVFALGLAIGMVIFKFRHKIIGVFKWFFGGIRWGIKDLRYARKRRKLKEQENIYGEY